VYDYFIEWVARPFYRFVVKPILFAKKMIKIFFKYLGKFLYYAITATTGNAIIISIVLLIYLKFGNGLVPKIDYVNAHPTTFLFFPVSIIAMIALCFSFIYNVCTWIFSSDRRDIIDKEPDFIQMFVEKISSAFYNIKKDVKDGDNKLMNIKRRRKEKRDGEKAVRMAAKRKKEEERIKKEEERKRKLDIVYDRAEIIDL
jgi:hypothetical protein